VSPIQVRQSDLKLWSRCPLAWRYQNIDGLPRTQGGSAVFGTVLHELVLYLETTKDIDGTLQRFTDMWLDPVAHLGEDKGRIDYYERARSWRKFNEMGPRILTDWWALIQWESDVVLAREYEFDVPIGDGHRLHGTVDKLALRYMASLDTQVVLISDYKCLDPETLVTMADGSQRRAVDVSVGDLVVGSRDGVLVPTRVSEVHDNGIQSRYRVATRTGRSVVTTGNHPFLTPAGWVNAEDLTAGQQVRVGLGWEGIASPALSEDEAWLLGFLVGDGGMSGVSLRFTSQTPELVARCTKIFAEMDCDVTQITGNDFAVTSRATGKGSRLASPHLRFIERAGLRGSNSHTKRVPAEVMTGGPAIWRAFVAGYFDADGAAREPDRSKFPSDDLHIASVNRSLLEDVQSLLAYLGIKASLYAVKATYKGEPYTYYRLGVRDQCGVALMARELVAEVTHPRKWERFREILRQGRGTDTRDNYAWDAVVAVEPLLAGPTIGLSVGVGTHVTGGLVTHNTAGKRPTYEYLEDDLQFTAYSFSTLQPEFWTGLPDGEGLYERLKDLPRRGEWVHLRDVHRMDAGPREQHHYNRLTYAVNAMAQSVALRIFVPDISGATCRFCEFRNRCGLPDIPEVA
jgi:hypothetical protein